MNISHKFALFCAAGLLGACSSTAPFSAGSAAANGDGTYTLTQDGVTRTLLAPDGNSAGTSFQYWTDANGPEKGYVYTSADVTAIAIMDETTHATMVGLSGTPANAVPLIGNATYNGDFAATYFRGGAFDSAWNVKGAFVTDIDFGTGAVTGTGTGTYTSNLAISGTLSGTTITGDATFSATDYAGAATVPMIGGLYTSGTLAGVYQGADVAGVFWGQ